MRYVSGFLKIVLFLFLLSFAVKNSDVVVLRYYLGYQWQTPLVLVLLIFFALGAATGVMACLGYLFRQRRELQRLRLALEAASAIPMERETK
ncbi:MAG TPA: LapA family protein [Burkholderiales bacterium]|nr:LapA family protein [Burkholderiales bacterium]